jgi:hypothetical protein
MFEYAPGTTLMLARGGLEEGNLKSQFAIGAAYLRSFAANRSTLEIEELESCVTPSFHNMLRSEKIGERSTMLHSSSDMTSLVHLSIHNTAE